MKILLDECLPVDFGHNFRPRRSYCGVGWLEGQEKASYCAMPNSLATRFC
jgi:hypothetical protein